jgi:hypothetical protein
MYPQNWARRSFINRGAEIMSQGLRYAAAVAAIALSVPFAVPAHAQGSVRAGTLTCNASGTVGFIFGSTRQLGCTFSGPTRTEHYSGDISRFGVDIGFTQGGVLIWAVFAPAADAGPGALAGTYGGVTAGATVGVGLGANVLVGGSNNTIALQPVSIEGTTGLNVAAGVASLTLTPMAAPR